MGTAALGRPAEQGSAFCSTGKSCRALLDRAAEGGCPHAVRGIQSALHRPQLSIVEIPYTLTIDKLIGSFDIACPLASERICFAQDDRERMVDDRLVMTQRKTA